VIHKNIATLKWRYKKFLKLVFATVALSICIPTLAHTYARVNPKQPENFTQHLVKPGDTLWGISEKYIPDVDPRLGIEWIEGANEMPQGYILQPGDKLEVPIYEGGVNS